MLRICNVLPEKVHGNRRLYLFRVRPRRYYMLSQLLVLNPVRLVAQRELEIETGQKGLRYIDLLAYRHVRIKAPELRISAGKNSGLGRKRSDNGSFCNAYRLYTGRFVHRYLVVAVHLVELVYGDEALVAEDERARFEHPGAQSFIFCDSCGEAGSRGSCP